MEEKYVVLTGSKNNAGDYLIKLRGKQLLRRLRPEKDIVDFNGWENVDDEKLEIINSSKALILLGGPSLRKNMFPGIYPLRKSLDDIKVPIIAMGIGWKSQSGSWADTHNYALSKDTLKLLKKIDETGYLSSVRDFHSQNVLYNYGITN